VFSKKRREYIITSVGQKVAKSTEGMHELFQNVLKTFQIGKEEVDIIKGAIGRMQVVTPDSRLIVFVLRTDTHPQIRHCP